MTVGGSEHRLPQREWDRLRDHVFQRDDRECANCRSSSQLEVHHVVPISRGGTNRERNLITLCKRCHHAAHNEARLEGTVHQTRTDSDRWVPTVAEMSEVIQQTHHPLERAVLLTLAKTGMGVGELCNLDRADVHLTAIPGDPCPEWASEGVACLRIKGPEHDDDSPFEIRRERRHSVTVPVDEELAQAFRRWVLLMPDPLDRPAPFFMNTSGSWGERITPSAVREMTRRAAKRVGRYRGSQLKNLTPLTFRYYFAERFLGQLEARELVLGRKSDTDFSFDSFVSSFLAGVPSVLEQWSEYGRDDFA